jgi:hypothetical protein
MDDLDPVELWNLWYHKVFNKYCETRGKWVVRDDVKCISCNPDDPKCFVVGGNIKCVSVEEPLEK